MLSRFDKLLPKSKLCTSLKFLDLMVAKVGVSIFGGGTALIQTQPILVLKVVFGKVNPNSCRVPSLKSLASTVAEISKGPQFLGLLH